jgi:hypothetical protein
LVAERSSPGAPDSTAYFLDTPTTLVVTVL